MKNTIRGIGLAAALTLAITVGCSDDKNVTAPEPSGVESLRESLAPYSSFALAKAAGYSTALTDCMSNGDEGAMGVHYANTSLIDATADSLHPEALIYEPGASGDASLVGVEFIVPYAAVARSSTPPVLFGQAFTHNDVFGIW